MTDTTITTAVAAAAAAATDAAPTADGRPTIELLGGADTGESCCGGGCCSV